MELQKDEYLAKAYEKAAEKDFSTALHYLRQIPREISGGELIAQKLAEYEQKQLVRATYLLQQAYNQAELGQFDTAIEYLQKVPKNTLAFAKARVKLAEYNSKKRIIAKLDKAAASPNSNLQSIIQTHLFALVAILESMISKWEPIYMKSIFSKLGIGHGILGMGNG